VASIEVTPISDAIPVVDVFGVILQLGIDGANGFAIQINHMGPYNLQI
jgi:hypothetical protein